MKQDTDLTRIKDYAMGNKNSPDYIVINWEVRSIVSRIRPRLIKLWKTRRMIKRMINLNHK